MTDRFIDFSKAKDLNLYWVAIGLLLVALFYNLGVHPLYQEEPRRAIVALEMKINGNYISPTIQGEAYFKKPPVYNWLILVAYHIFGDYSEFAIRFFTVISHILFGLVVYLLCRKHINRTVALYATLVVSVSAHTFFYLSMLSEIDLFYSLISFLSIALIYHFYRLNRYYTLFIVVYLFAGIGTLSKGLPSIIFLGISLPLFFYLQKDFKRLFTLAHVMGMLIFIFIVGGYLYLFSQENDLEELGRTLFSESTDRADAGLSAFFTHLGTFPLTVLKVLLPASLFLPFINYSGLLNKLRENGFVWFCVIMFAANIIIYWISPGSKARYICMLTPFVSIALTYLLLMYPARLGIFRLFVLILSIVICLGVIVLPFLKGMSEIPNIIPNSIILFLASLILVIYSIRKKGFELMALIVL
ncbi:MAG: glycosyltransferase family 39 protein, partial [Bacteroidota bacterium]